MSHPLSIIGQTNARSSYQPFGLKHDDRFFHLYVIGQTGTGKSSLLENLILQDVAAGHGVAVIDPHGDLAKRLMAQIPENTKAPVHYLDTPRLDHGLGYNPLRGVRADKVPLAASGLMEAFKKLWHDAWGVRMEHILRNTLYALLEYGQASLPDILRMLAEPSYRATVLAHVKNEQVRYFWLSEFPNYNPRYRQESLAPIQNKVGALLADPHLYRIFVKPERELSFRKVMDQGEVLIVNLSKGELGDDSANLLGAILVTTIGLAAMSRADSKVRRPFDLYVDEFQSFTTLSVANMVSELRKYGVGLILAHQHLHQLEPEVRHAVLGNVGTLVLFRLGVEDAHLMAREIAPWFAWDDLTQLRNYDSYCKLMIDGMPSRPFSASTMKPSPVDP
jgi:Type IV secretion-system coupling protein DNA-binding domain